MTDRNLFRAPDATAQQALVARSFSWSGFAERGIVASCVPIPAYATQNQRACAILKSRPLISSRRIKWRNSLWSRRFWCPSFRLLAYGRPRSRFSISSRFRPRSMSNPCRARESTDLSPQRQDKCPASAPVLPGPALIRVTTRLFLKTSGKSGLVRVWQGCRIASSARHSANLAVPLTSSSCGSSAAGAMRGFASRPGVPAHKPRQVGGRSC